MEEWDCFSCLNKVLLMKFSIKSQAFGEGSWIVIFDALRSLPLPSSHLDFQVRSKEKVLVGDHLARGKRDRISCRTYEDWIRHLRSSKWFLYPIIPR